MSVNKRLISTGANIGFTIWTNTADILGAGPADGNDKRMEIYGNKIYISSYTDITRYTLSGTTLTSDGVSVTAAGVPYSLVRNPLNGKKIWWYSSPVWPYPTGNQEVLDGDGTTSFGSPSSSSLTALGAGGTFVANVDGSGDYIYSANGGSVYKINPSTNISTQVASGIPANYSATMCCAFDDNNWWVIYNSGSVAWSARKFNKDFSSVIGSDIYLGGFGGYQNSAFPSDAHFVSPNIIYIKGLWYHHLHKFVLS